MADAEFVLAVDSSLRAKGLAVLADRTGRVVASRSGLLDLSGLLGAIADLLEYPGGRIGSLLVARGPGSYMGVRSGLAAVLGVAQGRGLPIAVVGTLEVVAARADPRPGRLLALIAAGRGGVYGQFLEAGPSPTRWRPTAASVALRAGADWPLPWVDADWLVDPDGVAPPDRGQPAPLALVRSGAQALGLVAGLDPAPDGSGYDHVAADYGTRLGEPSWS